MSVSVEGRRVKSRGERGRPPLVRASRLEEMPHLAVELLCQEVRGKRVLVIGAAPLSEPIVVEPGEVTVVVNGAISTLPGVPDFWVVNSRANARHFKDDRLRLHKLMMEQCRDRHVRTVVFVTRAEGSEFITGEWLQHRNCTWERSMNLTPGGRAWVERESGGRLKGMERHTASLGVSTVALFLWAGAAAVRMRGFSRTAGYQYLPTDVAIDPRFRGHLETDVRVLANLVAAHPARLSGSEWAA